jgi:predicted kinase
MSLDPAAAPASSDQRLPALVIMVGAPGSGKSHLGRALSVALGAELIQTDAVRKELFPSPAYTSTEAATVYATCHRRIAAALADGKLVVFDGTNLRERRRRTLYQLAERAHAPAVVVVAYASEQTIRARLLHRAEGRDPDDQSDADLEIYLRMRRDTEPVPRPHIVANTETAPGPVIRLLEHRLASGAD